MTESALQHLLIKRFSLAACTYALVLVLVWVAILTQYCSVSLVTAVGSTCLVVVSQGVLYWVFRSGTIAVIVRQEIVLFIMGGIFVVETLSVVIQVASFKLTGRRVFRMAPIHHHFELKGWPEPRVIVRFWIITVILVLIGLATLKLR